MRMCLNKTAKLSKLKIHFYGQLGTANVPEGAGVGKNSTEEDCLSVWSSFLPSGIQIV